MKTKLASLLATFLLNFFIISSVSASHLAGGEITYKWIGGSTYVVNIVIFRDCAGIALATPTLTISSPCGITTTVPTTLTAGPILFTPVCSGVLTTCNGGTLSGLQRYQFSVTVTLPNTCSDWEFSYQVAARNAASTNLSNPGRQDMCLDTHLNDTLFEHDSPVFVGDPNMFFCTGTESFVDNEAMDQCDSLGYSLVCPLQALNTCVTYAASYNAYNFLTSSSTIVIDSTTGTITINPTNTGVYVYAVLVKQYKNGQLIGTIRRDVQLYITACTTVNHYPQISGIDSSTYQYSTVFPFNKMSCFNIYSADSDTAQTTRLTIIDSIPGASFVQDSSHNNASAQFCWMPSVNDTGCSHCFTVKVNDNNCPTEASRTFKYCITVADSGYTPKTIHGVCFLDLNNNGIQDVGEPGYDQLMVLSSGGSFSYSTQPSPQGLYINYADSGTITTTVQNLRPYFTSSPPSHTTIFTYAPGADSVNFAIAPIPGVQDLRITILPLSNAKPGRALTYQLAYTNLGTDTISGTIQLVMDYNLSFSSSSPTYATLSGDSIGWTYSNLLPGETRYINVYLNVSSSVSVGTILNSTASIQPIATDTTPADNVFQLLQTVKASWDPNNKNMLGGDYISTTQIASGEYLTYLIGFQNTGNDTAMRVIILDTLDSKLDGSTFEMIAASHPYTVEIKDQKDIKWAFNNILLPDSTTNEPASHGYVCYRIKPKSTVTGGDVINNIGNIIFDYNQPVTTNTAVTTVTFPTTIVNIGHVASSIHLFPNPSNGIVTLSYSLTKASDIKIEIYNSFGQEIKEISNSSQTAGKQQITFDSEKLAAGIYFIKMSVDENTAVIRMVKM